MIQFPSIEILFPIEVSARAPADDVAGNTPPWIPSFPSE